MSEYVFDHFEVNGVVYKGNVVGDEVVIDLVMSEDKNVVAHYSPISVVSPISIPTAIAVGTALGVGTFAVTRNPTLSLIMVALGGMGGAIVPSMMSPKGKAIYYCEVCGAPLDLAGLSSGVEVKCPRCDSIYEVTFSLEE